MSSSGESYTNPRFRCRTHKFAWFSLEEAWAGAFRLFAQGVSAGVVLTPYRCWRSRTLYGEVRMADRASGIYGHRKIRVWYYVLKGRNRMRGCQFWHLTRSTAHLLGPGKDDPMTEDEANGEEILALEGALSDALNAIAAVLGLCSEADIVNRSDVDATELRVAINRYLSPNTRSPKHRTAKKATHPE